MLFLIFFFVSFAGSSFLDQRITRLNDEILMRVHDGAEEEQDEERRRRNKDFEWRRYRF